MFIAGINGSPRKGNSFTLLEKFLEGAEKKGFKTKLIDACKLKISYCMECGYCSKKGICRINDQMTEIREILSTCSHIAVASPVFFFGISSQLKTLIDRCQPLWAQKYILKQDFNDNFNFQRKGYFFSTGGFDRKITFKGGELSIKSFFDALSLQYEGGVLATSMENKDDISKEKTLLKKAYNLGLSI